MSDEPSYSTEIDRDVWMASVTDAAGDPLEAIHTAAEARPTDAVTVQVT